MEEIDLKEVIELFWKNKLIIILFVMVSVICGVIYTTKFVKPLYSSYTTLVLAKSSNNDLESEKIDESITTTDITINSKLVSTYSELVKSKNVLRQVINNLNIDIEEEVLRKCVSVKAVNNTELIQIVVVNENKELAKEIANEIAIVFIDTVKDIYKIENIRVVDIAEESENPSNINHKKDIAIFIAGGIVLSSMIILVMYMFDTTIKSADEIEEIFNIPVLASIPINEDKFQNNRKKSKRGGRYSEKRVNSI